MVIGQSIRFREVKAICWQMAVEEIANASSGVETQAGARICRQYNGKVSVRADEGSWLYTCLSLAVKGVSNEAATGVLSR